MEPEGPKPRTLWIVVAVAAIVVVAGVGAFLVFQPGPAPSQTIVLGAPLSTNFVYGFTAQRGMQLAIEEINANGGVQVGGERYEFALEVIDTRDLEPGVPVQDALTVVEQLITQRGADIIIGGPVRSEAAIAAMDVVSAHETVHLLTTGALSPAIHSRVADDYETYKYTFRITSEAIVLSQEALDILTHIRDQHGFDSVYIMVQDVAHARAIGGLLKSRLEDAGGWDVFPTEGPDIYPTGATDYSLSLQNAKDLGAELLFIWMDHPETSILMRQWNELQVPALPVTGINSAMESPTAWGETGGYIEYVIASPVNTGNALSNYAPAMEFFNAYQERWAIEPEGYGAVSSYTGVYVLKDAIERAGTLESEALIAALETTDYMGPYGRIRFNASSHQVIPSYDPAEGAVTNWFQWLDGERKQIWPQTVAVTEIQIPAWMLES